MASHSLDRGPGSAGQHGHPSADRESRSGPILLILLFFSGHIAVLRARGTARLSGAIGAFQAQPTVAAAANEPGETDHAPPPGIAQQDAEHAFRTKTEGAPEPRSEG